jgi:hypothetical protein
MTTWDLQYNSFAFLTLEAADVVEADSGVVKLEDGCERCSYSDDREFA